MLRLAMMSLMLMMLLVTMNNQIFPLYSHHVLQRTVDDIIFCESTLVDLKEASPASEALTRVPCAPSLHPVLPLNQLVPAKPLNLFSLHRLLCSRVKSLNLKKSTLF